MTMPYEIRELVGADREYRAFARLDGCEVRAEGDSVVFTGYASVFDVPYDVAGLFMETVKRGAFARTLKERSRKVHFLVNHNEDMPALASVHAGTMRLSEDERGLRVEADLDPKSPWAQTIISAVSRGDMDEMSFAFRVAPGGDDWDDGYKNRTLSELILYEVSIVRAGANPATAGASIQRGDETPAEVPEVVADEIVEELAEPVRSIDYADLIRRKFAMAQLERSA